MKINVKTLSIIGMQKNAGKTTVLNHILQTNSNKRIAITSIGRDGEKLDSVFKVAKPRIFVKQGMFVLSTDDCLKNSDCRVEIFKNYNIKTPLGEIVLGRVIDDGYVDLAGPSTIKETEAIYNDIKSEIDLFIVDGAFSRKQFASSHFIEGVILVTGASYSEHMMKTVEDTHFVYKMLSLKKTKKRVKKHLKNPVTILGSIDKPLDLNTSLGSGYEIASNIDSNTKGMVIKGAFTETIAEALIKSRHKFSSLKVYLLDGTKAFLDNDIFKKLKKINVHIEVINEMKLLYVAYNPYSPLGYEYDDKEFYNALTERIDVPVVNVLKPYGGEDE